LRSSDCALGAGHLDAALALARFAVGLELGELEAGARDVVRASSLLALGRALAARGDLVGADVALRRVLDLSAQPQCFQGEGSQGEGLQGEGGELTRLADEARAELAEARYASGDLDGAVDLARAVARAVEASRQHDVAVASSAAAAT